MIHIMISGCNGRMGRTVTRLCQEEEEMQVVAGVDRSPAAQSGYPVYADALEFPGNVDCVIDFSNPAALTPLLRYCQTTGAALVLGTTGYSPAQLEEIQRAARQIRIFRSANLSLGVSVLTELVRRTAKILGSGWDIEIVEKHHNQKLDAPSGTALMLADAVASALPEKTTYVYDRHTVRQPRQPGEIGISSVRGGTIVGEHEVLFAGRDEVLELKHTAYSREIFAAGAVRAAAYLASCREPGLYNMENLVSEVLT